MILGDSPIYDVKDDKLGRNNFATKIAEMIVSYSATNESGIVLGLEGDWGSGKTSIINLIKSKIENRKDLHVAYLNSWLAADKDTLVIEFFKGISEIVAIGNKHPLDYTDIEGYASNFINKASRGITINMPFVAVDFSKIVDKSKQGSLKKQKEQINEKLISWEKENDFRKTIVYFIDDVDRLSDIEISTVFQLVKNIADFPGIIYILAYDRNIVETALNRIQKEHGREYLQKIIQVPLSIPRLDEDKVYEIFNDKLMPFIHATRQETFDEEHLKNVFHSSIKKYIKNIRECNRIINAFTMKFELMKNECDLADLLAITILEIYELPLVIKMKGSKFQLCGYYNEIYSELKEKDAKQKLEYLLEGYTEEKRQDIINILSYLFPRFINICGIGNNYLYSYQSSVATNKICDIKSFDRYFILSLKENITTVEIIDALESGNEKDVVFVMVKWNRSNELRRFFERSINLIDAGKVQLTSERISILLHALSKIRTIEFERVFLEFSVKAYEGKFLNCLLQHINKNELYNEILSCFHDKMISLSVLTILITYCSAGYDWYSASNYLKTAEKLVSSEQLKTLENVFFERVNVEVQDGRLLDEEEVQLILFYWSQRDINEYKQFINDHKDFVKISKLIAAFINVGGVYDDKGYRRRWYIEKSQWPEKEMPIKECFKSMKKFIVSKEFKNLILNQQENIAALLAMEPRFDESKNEVFVYEDAVNKILNEITS
jgi:hypothetical protein